MAAPPAQANSELSARLLQYTNSVDSLETPEKVLNALDEVTHNTCKIRMLGALLLPHSKVCSRRGRDSGPKSPWWTASSASTSVWSSPSRRAMAMASSRRGAAAGPGRVAEGPAEGEEQPSPEQRFVAAEVRLGGDERADPFVARPARPEGG